MGLKLTEEGQGHGSGMELEEESRRKGRKRNCGCYIKGVIEINGLIEKKLLIYTFNE